MTPRDSLAAILVAAVWGVNFCLIRIGLDGVPPLTLCVTRFALVIFPWILFVPFPKIRKRLIVAYGLFVFAFQFGFLFTSMKLGFPPGLSSLVLQTQVFFTMGLSAILFSDRPGWPKIPGALVAFSGVALVGLNSPGTVTFANLALILIAAVSFASGNLVSRAIGRTDPMPLVVWGSAVALPVLASAALAIEGPSAMVTALTSISLKSVGALLYIVYLSTFLAFEIWNRLLSRYTPSTVAPFTLLVPVFGFVSSSLIFGETFNFSKIVGSLLVIFGLGIGQFRKLTR